MARDIQEVIDEMVLDKESRTELDVLTNPSNVSIWYNMLGLFAAEVVVLESLFDELSADLNTRKLEIPTGTIRWYAGETLLFQFGDSLIIADGIPQYALIDVSKQIVKVASATESAGFVLIKAAKLDGSGNPIPLEALELSGLEQYWIEKRFAGTSIQIISQTGDYMKVVSRIEVDGQKIDVTGQSVTSPGTYPVEEAIKTYWKELDFNGRFLTMSLVDAIQSVDGVNNVVINEILAKAYDAAAYTDVTNLEDQSYIATAGYIIEDPANLLSNTLTYII